MIPRIWRASLLPLLAGAALVGSSVRSLAAGPVDTLGIASFYGEGFDSLRTASGERFNRHRLTAAHRSLPFGTLVRVTNLRNGRQVVVRINDRGPFIKGRLLDLSHAAARRIGLLARGVGRVRLEVL